MKALVCNILLLLLVSGLSTHTLSAKEFEKKITREFDISKNGTVGLSNKYGKIDVQTWSNDEVKIDVIITVNARNQKDADEVFEKIDVDFFKQNNHVTAITIINARRSKLDYSIDYEVFMPTACRLELKNKYGNTFVAGLKGTANVNVKYGNIRLNTVDDDLDIDLKYGNCTVVKSYKTTIKMEHGNIYLKEATDVDLQTRYSKVNLDKANDITCDTRNDIYKLGVVNVFRNSGRYDNLDIHEVEQIVVDSEFSDLFVGKMKETADIKMKYGGVIFDHVSANFADIILTGEKTDFKIRMGTNAAYQFEITGRYCPIRIPEIVQVISKESNGSEKWIKGFVGLDNSPRIIKANLKNGTFKLR